MVPLRIRLPRLSPQALSRSASTEETALPGHPHQHSRCMQSTALRRPAARLLYHHHHPPQPLLARRPAARAARTAAAAATVPSRGLCSSTGAPGRWRHYQSAMQSAGTPSRPLSNAPRANVAAAGMRQRGCAADRRWRPRLGAAAAGPSPLADYVATVQAGAPAPPPALLAPSPLLEHLPMASADFMADRLSH